MGDGQHAPRCLVCPPAQAQVAPPGGGLQHGGNHAAYFADPDRFDMEEAMQYVGQHPDGARHVTRWRLDQEQEAERMAAARMAAHAYRVRRMEAIDRREGGGEIGGDESDEDKAVFRVVFVALAFVFRLFCLPNTLHQAFVCAFFCCLGDGWSSLVRAVNVVRQ